MRVWICNGEPNEYLMRCEACIDIDTRRIDMSEMPIK